MPDGTTVGPGSAFALAMSDCGHRAGIDEDLRALASSSADMRSPLAVLVARVAVRSKADWGYGRFGENHDVGNVVASGRAAVSCIVAPQGRRNPGIMTGAHSTLGDGACWITHWSCFSWAGASALAVGRGHR